MFFHQITPEEAGVSSSHIIEFLKDTDSKGIELHSIMFLRYGKIFAESWWNPYSRDIPHIMFSFTKSLTSTAIGFAVHEGLISLSDKICDYFPEKLPKNPSQNLLSVSIKDLLTMSCGQSSEIPNLGMSDPDWIKLFFSQPFPYKPGTAFMYNSAGTNILSALITKISGLSLSQYLKPRLFEPLDIGNIDIYSLSDGTEIGGAGSRMTTEQMAKFIQFVANHGNWQGKQLLPAEWFNMASSKQIDTASSPVYKTNMPDWMSGYGFQFWRCCKGDCYRADGAYGQFGVISDKLDAIFIITSAALNFQDTLTCLWNDILPYFEDKPLQEDIHSFSVLKYILENNELHSLLSKHQPISEMRWNNIKAVPKSKIVGCWSDLIGGAGKSPKGAFQNIIPFSTDSSVDYIQLFFESDQMSINMRSGLKSQSLIINMNSHYSSFRIDNNTYGAVGTWRDPNTFEFIVRNCEAATGKDFIIKFSDSDLTLYSSPSIPDYGGLLDIYQSPIEFTILKE
jgi:CubicO group peptidase (beta-lactamase class C family)